MVILSAWKMSGYSWLTRPAPLSIETLILSLDGCTEGEGVGGEERSPHRFSWRLTSWLRRLPLKGGVISEAPFEF